MLSEGKPAFNAPMSRKYTDIVSDDKVLLTGQYSSQWDGLSHCGGLFPLDGEHPEICYYNGYRAGVDVIGPVTYAPDLSQTIVARREDGKHIGALKLGIDGVAAKCVQGRGVMIDLEKYYGLSQQIFSFAQIKKIMDAEKIEILPGDFVLFHTGVGRKIMGAQGKITKEEWSLTSSGLDGRDPEMLKWITESGVVALISDNVGAPGIILVTRIYVDAIAPTAGRGSYPKPAQGPLETSS